MTRVNYLPRYFDNEEPNSSSEEEPYDYMPNVIHFNIKVIYFSGKIDETCEYYRANTYQEAKVFQSQMLAKKESRIIKSISITPVYPPEH